MFIHDMGRQPIHSVRVLVGWGQNYQSTVSMGFERARFNHVGGLAEKVR
jgi:hypothetical protein